MICRCGSSRFQATGPNEISAIMTRRGPLLLSSPFVLERGENPFVCMQCGKAAPARVHAQLDRLLVNRFQVGETPQRPLQR